jgi:pimeloyl-ACP methyl ester carboxylesterase
MTTLNLDHTLSLRYRHQGSGPALLLFNGATLPLEFWDPVADALARDYQIVRFDQRNAGESVFNGTFTLNDKQRSAEIDRVGKMPSKEISVLWDSVTARPSLSSVYQTFSGTNNHEARQPGTPDWNS